LKSAATAATAAATAVAATATTATATAADLAKVGIGADVADRGLQGIGLTRAALLGCCTLLVLVGATKTGGDALGALGKAAIEGLLQRVGNGADVVEVIISLRAAISRPFVTLRTEGLTVTGRTVARGAIPPGDPDNPDRAGLAGCEDLGPALVGRAAGHPGGRSG
jgi:hypothetical protein